MLNVVTNHLFKFAFINELFLHDNYLLTFSGDEDDDTDMLMSPTSDCGFVIFLVFEFLIV